jgi:4-oxalomesaconate tautomerase
LAEIPMDGRFIIEHPTGSAEVYLETNKADQSIRGAGTIRTARKLMDGRVF